MKEEINLLPLEQQQLRRKRLYLYRAGQLLRRVDLALIVLVGMLLAAYVGMESLSHSLATRNSPSTQVTNDSVAQTEKVNTLLATVQAHRVNTKPWTPLVAQVLANMPTGVTLTTVRVNEATHQLILTGRFSSRDSVVEFQRRLATLKGIAKVEAPLSNFATGGENSFSFTLIRQNGV